MADHVGKPVRLSKAVSGADVGHVGAVQGIHHEPFFSVGVGDGIAYVPASYLDVAYSSDPRQPGADAWDNDAGEMDNDPVGSANADPASEPATAKVTAPQDVMAVFLDWRRRHHC